MIHISVTGVRQEGEMTFVLIVGEFSFSAFENATKIV